MTWTETFRNCGTYLLNTGIDTVTNGLNVIGSIGCYLGGSGVAFSNIVDEQLTASYYGSDTSPGQVNFLATATSMSANLSVTIPFAFSKNTDGGITYSLKDYLGVEYIEYIKLASYVFVASGMVLKSFSANIKLWNEGRLQTEYVKERHGLDIPSPSLKEYVFVNAESIFSSLNQALIGNAIMGYALNYFRSSSPYAVTYPSQSNYTVNSANYSGPVDSKLIPLHIDLDKNTTITFPIFNTNMSIPLEVHITAETLSNVTYGGGIFFKGNKKAEYPVAIPTVLVAPVYLASNFFSKKAKQLSDERLLHNVPKYDSIQNST